MPPPAIDVDALLAHAGWVRSLARSLVADAHRADDLVQRTFVAALEHPPKASTPLRRWLAAVLRNFAKQDRRAELRRTAREADSARHEAVGSAHDTAEAIVLQRELFEAVLALDEPYRSTIVQRFYEGLPPREIARREALPVKTVKTRLARALERLRTSLDRRHDGNREAWLPALLPLAAAPAVPASTLWSLLVDTKIKIAVAAVALAGAAAVVWSVETSTPAPPGAPTLAAVPAPSLEPSEKAASLAASPEAPARATLPEVVEPKKRELPAGHPPVDSIGRGRVLDVDGNAVAGVPIVFVGHSNSTPLSAFRSAEESTPAPLATSRADGTFELTVPFSGGSLLARSAEFTTVFASDLAWSQERLQENLVVVVAPRIGIGGVVVAEDGTPVSGAQIEIRVDRRIASNLAGIADRSFEIPWRTTADERGRFEIPGAPAMHATLVASASGYAIATQPSPLQPALDLRIVLKRVDKPFPRGEVVDFRGHPVPDALVSCNLSTTKTDGEGRFMIDIDRKFFEGIGPYPKDEIVAVKEGLRPARFAKPTDGWPAFVTLRLEGEALEIRGKVVDETGAGVANVEVWTPDEHGFGVVLEDVGHTGGFESIESLLRGTSTGPGTVSTGKDGAFVLGGLLDGEYRVVCLEQKSLLHAEAGPVPAGSRDVKLVLPGDARCVRVAGRVVSRSGKPVAGVMLHPGVRLARWPFANGEPPFPMRGDSTTTDAEGRFAFEKLQPDGLSFQVISANLLVMDWKPPALANLSDLEIVVALRCHVQVDLGTRTDLAESFVVLDAAGEKIEALEYQGPMAMVQDPVPIEAGRSPVVAVTEDATMLVLSKGGAEVARFPLALAPGELKIVRP